MSDGTAQADKEAVHIFATMSLHGAPSLLHAILFISFQRAVFDLSAPSGLFPLLPPPTPLSRAARSDGDEARSDGGAPQQYGEREDDVEEAVKLDASDDTRARSCRWHMRR
jgi:hypothetical protein